MFELWTDAGGRYGITSAVQLTKNAWNHVMGTFDGNNLTIYVNGAPQGTYGGLAAFAPSKTPTRSTSAATSRNTPYRMDTFRGRMDEIGIYSEALSAGTCTTCGTPNSVGWRIGRTST